jgi:anti-sigma factor RsiW
MHAVVMESLEEYLAGSLDPAALRDVEAHLSSCPVCCEELRGMQDISQMFGSLRSEESFEPAPGFYARVMQQVDRRQAAATLPGLFGLDLGFARRLVFASLLVLAVLGGFLVTRETIYPASGPSPEAILAQQDSLAFQTARAEDNMLITLTAYEH